MISVEKWKRYFQQKKGNYMNTDDTVTIYDVRPEAGVSDGDSQSSSEWKQERQRKHT